MLKRSTIVALALTLGGFTISAQEPATLLLRSGERIAGTLIDLGAPGFTIRVDGNERNIAKNDVAVVDFSGRMQVRQADLDRMNGQHVFVLRNGDIIRGEFFDIGGTHPLRLTVRTDNGERDVASNEVSHIVLARPVDSVIVQTPGTQPTAPSGEGTLVRVQASQQWVPTGITVQSGQAVNFSASGEIRLNSSGDLVATPAGAVGNQTDKSAPLPSTKVGALIGRIGAGGGSAFGRRGTAPFLIGDQSRVIMPATGQLYLAVNDSVLTDNSGSFEVRIAPAPSARR